MVRRNLQPLCGIWFGVAINEAVISSTGTHLDFSDSGFNCVIPWGKYKEGALVLWQIKMIVELEPGGAFFFMGSLIAHNVGEIEGVRNSIDLFCYKNVLSWKDKCDEERQGNVTTLTVTTPTTRLASPPRANHMASNTVD
jgi:hypothetical protein